MSRRPVRRRGRQRESFPWALAVLGAILLCAVIGGFGWLFYTASARNIALADNLCPKSGVTAQTLVLVDVSDTIASVTKRDLLNKLHGTAGAIPVGTLFELRVLEPGENNTRTLFSYCNPGNGAELDELTGNPGLAKKRWEEGFNAPLEAAMAKAVSAGEAETSPIMAAIQEIALERLGSSHTRSIPSKLYVASDMLENTEAFSMYQSGADFKTWQSSRAAVKYATDLASAEVEFWVIKRPSPVPSAQVADFWVQWVLENRGRPIKATALQGLE